MKKKACKRTSFLSLLLALMLTVSLSGFAYGETPLNPVTGDLQTDSAIDQADEGVSGDEQNAVPGEDSDLDPEETTENVAEGASDGVLNSQASVSFDGAVVTIAAFSAPGQLIDIPGQSITPGVQATLYAANSTSAQRFQLMQQSDGSYSIINIRSRLALDISGSAAFDGAKIIQWTYHGATNQRWDLVVNPDGSYTIVSKLNDAFCIDLGGSGSANGTPLVLFTKGADRPRQQFLVAPIQPLVSDGVYTIRAASGSTLLDISNISQTPGVQALTYQPNGGLNQRFVFQYDVATGYYSIAAAHSNLLLDVQGNGWAAGTPVIQWGSNGGYNQKWSVERSSADGNFIIRTASSGQSLDVSGGSASNGAKIIVYPLHGRANQQWSLTEVDLLSSGVYTVRVSDSALLDVSGRGILSGTKVGVYTANSGMNQRFYLKRLSLGVYSLEDMNSHKYVTVDSSAGVAVIDDWQENDSQKWRAIPMGGGRFALQSLSGGGKVLTTTSLSSGAELTLAPLTSDATQRWAFSAAAPINEGLYVFMSELDATKALDIPAQSRDLGIGLTLWTVNEGPAQRFTIQWVTGNFYRIKNLNSGLALDVSRASLDATTGAGTVIQYTTSMSNPANQLWQIEYIGGGAVRFVSALSGGRACLNVTGGVATNSAAVGVLDKNGSSAQAFYPKKLANITYENLSITLDDMVNRSTGTYGGQAATAAQRRPMIDPVQQSSAMMQFVDLRIPTNVTAAQIDSYIAAYADSRSVFQGKGSVFVAAARQYGLNENYFVNHAILETGWGQYIGGNGGDWQGFVYDGKTAINGTYYPAGTYYNFFGIAAYDSSALSSMRAYAVRQGWNSVDATIYGSAKWIAENYVYYGQPTLYDMRWDYNYYNGNGWCSYAHCYATGITWTHSIAQLMERLYNRTGTPDLYYIMPIYRS